MKLTPHKKITIKTQSGNILIYILGAIFLLGLLVVISKGSVTPGAGIDPETLMIRVAEVQEYGKELERAVAFVLANGHSEVDIRFAHPDANSAYGDITDMPTRQIFSREGGGATYRTPPNDIQTTATPWIFNGENRLWAVGQTCNGTTVTGPKCVDLMAILMNVSKEFCMLVNDKNSIPNPSNSPPKDVGVFRYGIFSGTYAYSTPMGNVGDADGKLEGCLEGNTDPPAGTYHYYRVLLAR